MTSKIDPKPFSGADDEIRLFEPLAITGLQPVEKISTHSFHQNLIHFRFSRNPVVFSPQVSPVH